MWYWNDATVTFDNPAYLFDGSTTSAFSTALAAGIFTLSGQDMAFQPGAVGLDSGTFTLAGQAMTFSQGISNYVTPLNAGIFNLIGAPSSSDFQADFTAGVFSLAGQAMTFSQANTQLQLDAGVFSLVGQPMTFVKSNTGILLCGTGIFTLNGQDISFDHIQPFPVKAVTMGIYMGQVYQPGDVFLVFELGDFSDANQNVQPGGAEYAPGWMILVAAGTPLYQAQVQNYYPTFPPADPAKRSIL